MNGGTAALIAATVLTAIVCAPVAVGGANGAVDGADYVIWRWNGPGPRGMGIVEGTSNTIMRSVTIKLRASSEYRIVGSSVGCGKQHRASNTVMRSMFESDSNGTAFSETIPDDRPDLATIRSVRLFRGSNQVECGRAGHYSGGPSYDPLPTEQISFNIFENNNRTVGMILVDPGSGNDQLNFVFHELEPQLDHRVVGSDVSCPDKPANGMRLFRRDFMTSARGTRYEYDAQGNLASALPTSVHLYEVGRGRIACSESVHLVPAT